MELLSCFFNWILFLFWTLILPGSGNFPLIYLGFHTLSFGVVSTFIGLTYVSGEPGFQCCQQSIPVSDEASLFLSGSCHWSTQVPSDVALSTNYWKPEPMASCLARQAETWKLLSCLLQVYETILLHLRREGSRKWHLREHWGKGAKERSCF